jgi:hypothetical protein
MRTAKRSICPGDIAVLKDGRYGRIRIVIGGTRGRVCELTVAIDQENERVIPQQVRDVIPVLRSEWRERLRRDRRLARQRRQARRLAGDNC